jgi:hypothetical protein
MSNNSDNYSTRAERRKAVRILPYNLTTQSPLADVTLLFVFILLIIGLVYIGRDRLNDTCNANLMYAALTIYFIYNLFKYPVNAYFGKDNSQES